MAKNNILVNDGACMIIFGDISLKPNEEMEVDSKELALFEHLIAKGIMKVKDNSALNEEITERANKKKKKDPNEGKSLKELEDGGVY